MEGKQLQLREGRKGFWAGNELGDSGLMVVLVAENGDRRTVDKTALIPKSQFFEDFLAIFPDCMDIPCRICSDAVVMDLWIGFMVNDLEEVERILSELEFLDGQRMFWDLNRIVDYYMIPGMAVQNLKMFRIYIEHGHCWDFWTVPVYFLDEEERLSWNAECLRLERRFFAHLYDSPHYLAMDFMEFLLTLFGLEILTPETCFRALNLYVEVNHDRLFGETVVTEEVFASAAYNLQFILVRDTLEKILANLNASVPTLNRVVDAMHLRASSASQLLDVSIDRRNPWLPFTYQVYGEFYRYPKFSFPLMTGFRLLAEKKLLLVDQNILMIRDLETGSMTQLGLPITSGYCILITWQGKLHAVDCDHMWELRIKDNYSWLELNFDTLGCPFRGCPSLVAVGDRLFVFPTESDGDWVRYISKGTNSQGEEELKSFFIEPTEDNREVRDLLNFNFGGSAIYQYSIYNLYISSPLDWPITTYSGLICPQGNEAFLFARSEVLIVDRDRLAIVGRRPWPELPRSQSPAAAGLKRVEFLTVQFASEDFYILYNDCFEEPDEVRKISLFKFNFTTWTFVEVLADKFASLVPLEVTPFVFHLNPSIVFCRGIDLESNLNLLIRHNDDPSAIILIRKARAFGNISLLGDSYKFSILPTSYNEDELPFYMVQQNLVTFNSGVISFWNLEKEEGLEDLVGPSPGGLLIGWNEDLVYLYPPTTKLWAYDTDRHRWSLKVSIAKVSTFKSAFTTRDRLYLTPATLTAIGDRIEYFEKDCQGGFHLKHIEVTEANKFFIDLMTQSPPTCRFTQLTLSAWRSSSTPPTDSPQPLQSGLICPFADRPIAFLFSMSLVLEINTESLEVLGRRGWPTLPRPNRHLVEGLFADKCFVVVYAGLDGSALEAYNFDFKVWEFHRVVVGEGGSANGSQIMDRAAP